MALDKGDCPLGRGMGEGLPVGAAAGVLLIVWSGGGVCVCVCGDLLGSFSAVSKDRQDEGHMAVEILSSAPTCVCG